MERILIVLAAPDTAAAEAALRSAREQAVSAERVSFRVVLTEAPNEWEEAALKELGAKWACAEEGTDPWGAAEQLWQGENYRLMATEALRFEHHWDLRLLRALRACAGGETKPALTGFLPLPAEPVTAVSPVAATGFDEAGRLCFGRGTMLLHAKTSVKSAFLHPAFCFASSAFYQALNAAETPTFLAAFTQKLPLFTLHDPALSWTQEQPIPSCATENETEAWTRFGQCFGLSVADNTLEATVRTGLFEPPLDFPRRVPLPLQAQEAVCRLLRRGDETTPMCVTAFLPMGNAHHLPEEYMLWFSYLARLRAVPLTCYTETHLLRRMGDIAPGVLEYKAKYGLPVHAEAGEDARFRLGKLFLLRQAKETFIGQSHFVWMDFGYLRYPAWEKSSVNWDAVCQEAVVLATVDGVPDLSMVCVPREMLDEVCAELLRICEDAAELPEETFLWQTMMKQHPAWFAPIALPARRQLFSLTMLSREEAFHGFA